MINVDEEIQFIERQIAVLDALEKRMDATAEDDVLGLLTIARDLAVVLLQDPEFWKVIKEEDIVMLKRITDIVGSTEECEAIFEESDVFFGYR